MSIGYEQIGSLVDAIGKPWFYNTLQGVLQTVYRYDYFLLVHIKKPRAARVKLFDFPGTAVAEAMRHYEAGTHVIDPLYQLFVNDQLEAGVHDMADLSRRAEAIVRRACAADIPNVVRDDSEEIGFRTIGWPKYLQETCLLMPLDVHNAIGVSLYNCGLLCVDAEPLEPLRHMFPALAAIVRQHAATGRPEFSVACEIADKQVVSQKHAESTAVRKPVIEESDIVDFFDTRLQVKLTWREASVMAKLLAGQTVAAIAHELGNSPHTIKTHRRNVYRKAGHGRLLELMNQYHSWRADSVNSM